MKRSVLAKSLVILMLVGLAMAAQPPPARSAPSGAGWTAIIIGGTIVLYEFGYRYPIDNVKIKGAWREAEDVTNATYDGTVLRRAVFPTPSGYTANPTGSTAVVTNSDGTPFTCTVQAATADKSPSAKDCVYDPKFPASTPKPDQSPNPTDTGKTVQRLLVYYSVGGETTLKDLRSDVIQTVVESNKNSDGTWRDRYDSLRTCWNSLVYVDPTTSPSASPKSGESPKPSPSASASHPSGNQHGNQHGSQGGGQQHGGHGSGQKPPGYGAATALQPMMVAMTGGSDLGIGGYLAAASGKSGKHPKPAQSKPKPSKPTATSPKPASPKPSPSPSPTPPIASDSCAFGLGGQQGPTSAPALVDTAQRMHPTASPPSPPRVIYVDLRDAAKAFETTDSLRQQIIDRRVGPNQVENLERAEVIAQLASAFNGDFNPSVVHPTNIKVQMPTPVPTAHGGQLVLHGPPGIPSYSSSATGLFQEAYTAYGSCVTKFDFQGCESAISGPEQQLVGTIATKNACAFASDYWLPSVTAIGMVYGSEMSASFHNSESPTPSPVPTSDIGKKSFSSPPGC